MEAARTPIDAALNPISTAVYDVCPGTPEQGWCTAVGVNSDGTLKCYRVAENCPPRNGLLNLEIGQTTTKLAAQIAAELGWSEVPGEPALPSEDDLNTMAAEDIEPAVGSVPDQLTARRYPEPPPEEVIISPYL